MSLSMQDNTGASKVKAYVNLTINNKTLTEHADIKEALALFMKTATGKVSIEENPRYDASKHKSKYFLTLT